MINTDEFAQIIGLGDNPIHVEEVRGDEVDPTWIHSDLGRRLNAFPRENWIAVVYDAKWGLLFIYKVGSKWQGVAYRDIDVMNVCIMMQYAAVVHFKTRWLHNFLTAGHKQVAITWINDHRPRFAHHDTQITLPLPQSGTRNSG